MSIFDFIGNLFSPVTTLIDTVSTTDEERMELRNALAKIQAGANAKIIELEQAKIEALSKIQIAEANSTHKITATWRPICSIALVALIICGSFDLVKLTPDIYELAKVFLGTYTAGRSIEKLGSVIKLGKG